MGKSLLWGRFSKAYEEEGSEMTTKVYREIDKRKKI